MSNVPTDPVSLLGRKINVLQERIYNFRDEVIKRAVDQAKDTFKGLREFDPAKGETSGVKIEGTVISAGLKVIQAEKAFLNVEDILLKRKGLDPESLKASIQDTREAIGRSFDVAHKALRSAKDAHSRLDRTQRRTQNSVQRAQQANIGNTGSFTETAQQINRLEQRIESLVRALS